MKLELSLGNTYINITKDTTIEVKINAISIYFVIVWLILLNVTPRSMIMLI